MRLPDESVIKEEDKELFIKTLNQKGFLLEDKSWKILDGLNYESLSRNKVINHNGTRVEIDFLFESKRHNLIIECKRTDYSWIFPKALERDDTFTFIFDSDKGTKTNTRCTPEFKTTWFDIAVAFEDGKLKKQNNHTVQTSYKDVHDHVKQVLNETQAYVYNSRFKGKMVVPVIITNAKLYQLSYLKGDIDPNGDLVDFQEINEIKGIVYNFPEIMNWDGGKQIIKDMYGEEMDGHTKSVIIININYVSEIIKLILDQSVPLL